MKNEQIREEIRELSATVFDEDGGFQEAREAVYVVLYEVAREYLGDPFTVADLWAMVQSLLENLEAYATDGRGHEQLSRSEGTASLRLSRKVVTNERNS